MLRAIKYYFSGFLIAWIFTFLIFIWIYEFKLCLIVSTICGVIFGLFSLGFMIRKLQTSSLEVNTLNKDPKKGMEWYYQRIIEQLIDLRFIEKLKVGEITTFKPRGLYQIFESEVTVQRTPYFIKITGSRLVIRIVGDYLDLSN